MRTFADSHTVEIFYSSLYRQFLAPNNATHESIGFVMEKPWFSSYYCTWDTFRTYFPFLSLHSAADYADVVGDYVESWKHTGIIPECRANGVPGWKQGGSDGTNVVADFAVKYFNLADQLGVNISQLHDALISDAFSSPADWNRGGRQIDDWRKYHYLPYYGPSNVIPLKTREASRSLEYAQNDFAAFVVSRLVNDTVNASQLRDSALWYSNVFDQGVESQGFSNFVQQRYPNGAFRYVDPITCSPIDTDWSRSCSMQLENSYGTYESSSWEYSLYAPHDMAVLIKLLASSLSQPRLDDEQNLFIRRLDKFFELGLHKPGNEPSF